MTSATFTVQLPCTATTGQETIGSNICRKIIVIQGIAAIIIGILALTHASQLSQIGVLSAGLLIAYGTVSIVVTSSIKRVKKEMSLHHVKWVASPLPAEIQKEIPPWILENCKHLMNSHVHFQQDHEENFIALTQTVKNGVTPFYSDSKLGFCFRLNVKFNSFNIVQTDGLKIEIEKKRYDLGNTHILYVVAQWSRTHLKELEILGQDVSMYYPQDFNGEKVFDAWSCPDRQNLSDNEITNFKFLYQKNLQGDDLKNTTWLVSRLMRFGNIILAEQKKESRKNSSKEEIGSWKLKVKDDVKLIHSPLPKDIQNEIPLWVLEDCKYALNSHVCFAQAPEDTIAALLPVMQNGVTPFYTTSTIGFCFRLKVQSHQFSSYIKQNSQPQLGCKYQTTEEPFNLHAIVHWRRIKEGEMTIIGQNLPLNHRNELYNGNQLFENWSCLTQKNMKPELKGFLNCDHQIRLPGNHRNSTWFLSRLMRYGNLTLAEQKKDFSLDFKSEIGSWTLEVLYDPPTVKNLVM